MIHETVQRAADVSLPCLHGVEPTSLVVSLVEVTEMSRTSESVLLWGSRSTGTADSRLPLASGSVPHFYPSAEVGSVGIGARPVNAPYNTAKSVKHKQLIANQSPHFT